MHPCLLYCLAPPNRYGAYSMMVESSSVSEDPDASSSSLASKDSSLSSVLGDQYTGLYSGLEEFRDGVPGGGCRMESSSWFNAICEV